MGTVTSLLSLEQFQNLPDDKLGRQELNAGELIEMAPPKNIHSSVLHAILFRLYEAAKDGRFVARAEAAYILFREPPTVRVPDVSLVAAERLEAADEDSYVEGAPEVAIEVVSPSQTAVGLNEKIRQLLAAGSQVVIVAYPKTRELHVFRPGKSALLLRGADRLEIPEALPGWSVPVEELFPSA